MPQLTLVSFDACPFVQRAAILLQEQGRPYKITYVDLREKPDWFLEISPNGKVPVLQVDDTPIFESAVILEYLDETAEHGQLLPEEGVFDSGLKYRSMVLPDSFIDQASPADMYEIAAMNAPQIEAKVLEVLGVATIGEKRA